MNKNKQWMLLTTFFLLWSLLFFLSMLWNYKTAINPDEIDRVIITHIYLWIIGIVFSLPSIIILFKRKNKTKNESFNETNFATLFNSISSPAFLFNKKTNRITHANSFAENNFKINKLKENHLEVKTLNNLIDELKKYSHSVVKQLTAERSCVNIEGKEHLYDAVLHDIFINNSYSTLIALYLKTESNIELEEMTKYIEDLHAKEDALEANAFEMIQLNIKLEESENNLREANASKDKFFSIVAHDLKSPFVGLLGITEMLDTDYDEFEEKDKKELIHSLYDISKNTFELLEGLLEWARAKQGRMEYNPKEFNFFQVADSLVNLLKANSFKKEITLHNYVDINATVYGDREMVATVLRNLLANAIKFTPQRGTIEIKSEIKKDLMEISVCDSGIGMSAANIDKLFRIDVNHTTLGTNNEKGTGLGLILCQELIDKHGTNIWAESELGEGSQFVFTLPITQDS